MNTIYIDSQNGYSRICIVEEGRLVEYYDNNGSSGLLGNIYRGRVVNVLQGMEAAFIDIGVEKNAYLYVRDTVVDGKRAGSSKVSISNILTKGQDIIVQVIKEPLGEKGPKVTMNISIAGRYMVLTPYTGKVSISKKIRDDEVLDRLKEFGRQEMKDGLGIILRTASENAELDVLKGEYRFLTEEFQKIEAEKNFLPTPKLIYSELNTVSKVIRDYFNVSNTNIIVNDKKLYNEIKGNRDLSEFDIEKILKYTPSFDMDYDMNIQMDMKEAFSRRVDLKSGGYIAIDETEALTAIDVNTGRYTGVHGFPETILKTNLEAAEEIAKHLRLRDIGGIIVVDFIDMKESKDMDLVVEKLKTLFKRDKNKPIVVDVTKLGLVEIVRKKNRPTLDKRVSIICPVCGGRGRIRENEA
ncbi:MAG: Rne/Rng family ribonuclease [Gudongella sp.]|jgi:ribonuclease G|nr:Rne/Rng family ribonuclease [Gudongella sp.]